MNTNAIDLNSPSFDSREVFNNGVAGIVENVGLRADVKKVDDKENAPSLKIVFIDNNKAEVNFGLWPISASSTDPVKDLTNLGRTAKHVFHAIYGPTYVIPPFKDDLAIIAGVKAAIDTTSMSRYRVAVNYGSEASPKAYLNVKRFAPFMENMTVNKIDSKLFLGNKDLLHPIKADEPTEAAPANAPKSSWVKESAPEEDKGEEKAPY